MFEIRVFDDYQEMSENASKIMLDCLQGCSVLCAATGQSPAGAYGAFSRAYTDKSQLQVLKLDEWGGLDRHDPSTCETYLRKSLVEPLGLPSESLQGFQSDAPNPEEECQRVQGVLERLGGIDLCVLGMGSDGHIGLNYPAETLPAAAWVTPASTLQHAMLDQALKRPTHGYTLGFAEILASRNLLLLVNGISKASALKRLVESHLTPQFPASFLRLHPDVLCLCDYEAAAELS